MVSLNDNNVFIGEIKQFLKNFNLPSCKIVLSLDQMTTPYKYYLYNDSIYYVTEDEEQKIEKKKLSNYIWNSKIENLTKNLKIDNLYYDRYTHRYLGNFLRFLRDYRGINLMSMYNCFDQEELESNLILTTSDSGNSTYYNKDTINYIYYKIPVTYGQEYTLAIQANTSINYCLYYSTDKPIYKEFTRNISYKKMFMPLTKGWPEADNPKPNGTTFENKENIYLLLKIPRNIKSSIVLLEGNYLKKHNYLMSTKLDQTLDSNPQLLTYLNNKNYLLADKLLEYLTKNVINNLSEDYDIKKVQKWLIANKFVDYDNLGIWSERDTLGLRNYIISKSKEEHTKFDLLNENVFDILGWFDKDVEKSAVKDYKYFNIED